MEKEALKQAALRYIEENRERLMQYGRDLYAIPEPGFREEKTAAYVKFVLESCGLSVQDHIAYTGLTARAAGRQHLANVAVMGELDSLIMPSHPKADPKTGYYHGCGHHAQLTTLLGVALGLVESGLVRELDGDLSFIGVPAEETIEQEYRRSLIDKEILSYSGGKQEMIGLGVFDDVDMVLCSHIMGRDTEPKTWLGHSWNGNIHKNVRFLGKSAHAGLAPERGINALEAALTALNAINAIRERFRDEDHVRVHYIITKGGSSPNVVPDDVRLEFGVRAATVEAMQQANHAVNLALRSGAEAVGAKVEIEDLSVYMPCHQSRALADCYFENARELLGEENVVNAFGEHRGSSTDCGNVACLKPLIHPYFAGAVGVPHGLDFEVVNDYAAYVVPAKLAAATIIDLLADGAVRAQNVKASFMPDFAGKEEFLQYSASLL